MHIRVFIIEYKDNTYTIYDIPKQDGSSKLHMYMKHIKMNDIIYDTDNQRYGKIIAPVNDDEMIHVLWLKKKKNNAYVLDMNQQNNSIDIDDIEIVKHDVNSSMDDEQYHHIIRKILHEIISLLDDLFDDDKEIDFEKSNDDSLKYKDPTLDELNSFAEYCTSKIEQIFNEELKQNLISCLKKIPNNTMQDLLLLYFNNIITSD